MLLGMERRGRRPHRASGWWGLGSAALIASNQPQDGHTACEAARHSARQRAGDSRSRRSAHYHLAYWAALALTGRLAEPRLV